MEIVTNKNAVKFADEKVRVGADMLAQTYYMAKRIVDEWYATNMSKSIKNTLDVIDDGSKIDGRTEITAADATSVITRLSEFVVDYEADYGAKLNTVLKPAVNPLRG